MTLNAIVSARQGIASFIQRHLATFLLFALAAHAEVASAVTVNTIYSFKASAEGTSPTALIQGAGSDQALYGMASAGSTGGNGSVFKITFSGPGSYAYSSTVLHAFTSSGATDGAKPSAGLFQASDGTLYGTTRIGGANNVGSVFQISPTGTVTTLYSFTGGNDGSQPTTSLVQGSDGTLYGTTSFNGAHSCGTIFKITPAGVLTTLYAFSGSTTNGCRPNALFLGADSNLYGTTSGGGAGSGWGTFFKMTPAGSLTTLYLFGSTSYNDGANPSAILQGYDGTFYGTTGRGGSSDEGVLFSIAADGTFTKLATFTGPNGAYPTSGLLQGTDGNLYGTTSQGGTSGQYGTIFKYAAGALTTLYNFTGGADGGNPGSGLIQDHNLGSLYGTTTYGGANSAGTAFVLESIACATPTINPNGGTSVGSQTITLADRTPNVTIRYTDDGTTPTISLSKKYTAPFLITKNTTIKAIATSAAYVSSDVASQDYIIAAAAPSFSPVGGTYNSSQTVSLSTTNSGVNIHYTTNGATPTASSPTYSTPISVSSAMTIKAIAIGSGNANSSVSSATYAFAVATPTFSPAAGAYSAAQTVTISDATPGAVIRYTTDGSTPTSASAQYTAPLTVNSTQTVKAIAVLSGYTNSAVGSSAYTITLPTATPSISPAGGTYTATQTVSITDSTPGATIYYTTNGSTPTTGSTPYTAPISVSTSKTISAIAVASGYSASTIASASYTITPPAASPTISPNGGSFTTPQTVTISDTTPGASIHYTIDGSTPTSASNLYTGPISVSSSQTIKAIATASGYSASAVTSATFTVTLTTATPAISPTGGTYTSAQLVTISDTTPGSAIYYTTDGSTPTSGSAVYTGPITVSTTSTIKAIATASGYSASAVASASFVIMPTTVAPAFSPDTGTYAGPQTVSLTDSTPNAAIYYTTDGTTPTTGSTPYSGPISVASSQTVKAIAIAPGHSSSTVSSATYTIQTSTAAPVFNPPGGSYTGSVSIVLSDTTAGATIYYTTDGSIPNVHSTVYSGPIPLSASGTIKAMASATGYTASGVSSATYSITTSSSAGSKSGGGAMSPSLLALFGIALFLRTRRTTLGKSDSLPQLLK